MRWLKFNAVGVLGIVVQTATLGLLVHILGMHYLLATGLAVEAAVLHNFFWHRRWTWADRQGVGSSFGFCTFLRFNLTNGVVSIAGNLFFMRILAGTAGLEPVVANLLSIALCALVNFLLADRFVFIPPDSCGPGDCQADHATVGGKIPRCANRAEETLRPETFREVNG